MPPPPGQPGPSPYQNPQPGAGAAPPPAPGAPQIPGQPPTGGGYGAPVPAQHNPYAQASPGFGPPQAGYYGAPPQAGAPAAGGGGKSGAGKAVLWAVVGAAVASALWGGGVLLLGKGSSSPDLRGYKPVKNLCSTADLSAFQSDYPKGDNDPTTYTSDRPALVQMYCGESLEREDSSYSTAYVSIEADLHRKADPGPEFEDRWKSFGDHGSKPSNNYKVTPVDGIGDEAYLITQDTVPTSSDSSSSSDSGDRTVVLAVRDGGLTITLSWDIYSVSADDSDKEPSLTQATDWVKTATKATMAKLK